MARGINLAFLADVKSFLAGTKSIESSLDEVSGSLDDLTRDAAATSDSVERSLDDTARAGDTAADKLETSFRDAFDGVSRESDRMRSDVGDSIDRTAGDGKTRAGEAGAEIGTELASNIGEGIGSGQIDIADSLQGTLGGLATVPGLGLAAIGAGLALAVVKGMVDRIGKAKRELAEATQTVFDAIEIDGSALTIKWNRQKMIDDAIDALTEGGRTEDLAKVAEWIKAGVGEDTIARALTGDLTPGDIAKLDRLSELKRTISVYGHEDREAATDTAIKAQEILDLGLKQNEAAKTANDLAQVQLDLYRQNKEEQRQINTLIRERPIDRTSNNRPGARWDD